MQETLRSLLNEGSLAAYPVVFVAGILASLTPCVYPLIPVTVAILGGSGVQTKWRGLFISSCYVLGIALTYSVLGIVAGATHLAFGAIATSPWAYFVLANACFVFGLWMLGAVSIPMPSFVKSNVAKGKTVGPVTALLMGLVFGLAAGPCTAPVLGVLLLFIGAQGGIIYGATLMFTFAVGLGLLLLIVGTFSAARGSLPKAGIWMERIKKFFGWCMLGVGEYFAVMMGRMLV